MITPLAPERTGVQKRLMSGVAVLVEIFSTKVPRGVRDTNPPLKIPSGPPANGEKKMLKEIIIAIFVLSYWFGLFAFCYLHRRRLRRKNK